MELDLLSTPDAGIRQHQELTKVGTAMVRVHAPRSATRRCLTTAFSATALSVAVAITVGLTGVRAAEAPLREYQIKAAFLLNFVRFVDWPATHPGTRNTLSLCVLGSGSVDDAFSALEGRRVRRRVIAYTRIGTADETSACDVIFMAGTEDAPLPDPVPAPDGTHLLTVGETRSFATGGGIIVFVYQKNKLSFEINLDAAERAGISIRSDLLTLASAVRQVRPER